MRERKQLIGDLSHRINNPLAAIRNALYLLGRQSTDPETCLYVAIAEQEVDAIIEVLREARATVEAHDAPPRLAA